MTLFLFVWLFFRIFADDFSYHITCMTTHQVDMWSPFNKIYFSGGGFR